MAVYVPAASPVELGVSVMVAPPSMALNHPVGSPEAYPTVPSANPASAPPPAFVTVTVAAAGEAPPTSPTNATRLVETASSADGPRVSVTAISCGLLTALASTIGTVAV